MIGGLVGLRFVTGSCVRVFCICANGSELLGRVALHEHCMRGSGLNLPGAGFRVIKNALTPGGGSPLHSGGLKSATDPNWVRSGA